MKRERKALGKAGKRARLERRSEKKTAISMYILIANLGRIEKEDRSSDETGATSGSIGENSTSIGNENGNFKNNHESEQAKGPSPLESGRSLVAAGRKVGISSVMRDVPCGEAGTHPAETGHQRSSSGA